MMAVPISRIIVYDVIDAILPRSRASYQEVCKVKNPELFLWMDRNEGGENLTQRRQVAKAQSVLGAIDGPYMMVAMNHSFKDQRQYVKIAVPSRKLFASALLAFSAVFS